jgi:excinuclease ABC subunit A
MVLAPLVVGRKGEQAELFDELRAQGFVRLRIDGEVHEIDRLPKLDRNRKHTIEIVIDRVKIEGDRARPGGIKQRLAESFETALRHADGRAVAVEIDSGKEHLFSSKFACPVCSYSIPELEPRLFSFNNPMGACPRCDGLGEVTFFDPKRVVAFPHLSLAGGAVRGWDRRNQFYFAMLSRSRSTTSSTSTRPSRRCPSRPAGRAHRLGRGEDRLPLSRREGPQRVKEHAFEGILPNLERRYRETDSVAGEGGARQVPQHARLPRVRRHEAARGGAPRARRRPATSTTLSSMPLRQSQPFFAKLELPGSEGGDRRRDRARDRQPRAVPEQRRALTTCRSPARPTRSRAARRNASGSRARSAPASPASMYVLDEPSIGPAPARQRALIADAEEPARPRATR